MFHLWSMYYNLICNAYLYVDKNFYPENNFFFNYSLLLGHGTNFLPLTYELRHLFSLTLIIKKVPIKFLTTNTFWNGKLNTIKRITGPEVSLRKSDNGSTLTAHRFFVKSSLEASSLCYYYYSINTCNRYLGNRVRLDRVLNLKWLVTPKTQIFGNFSNAPTNQLLFRCNTMTGRSLIPFFTLWGLCGLEQTPFILHRYMIIEDYCYLLKVNLVKVSPTLIVRISPFILFRFTITMVGTERLQKLGSLERNNKKYVGVSFINLIKNETIKTIKFHWFNEEGLKDSFKVLVMNIESKFNNRPIKYKSFEIFLIKYSY